MYLIFGTLTTAVNIVVYYLFSNIIHINYLFSNAVAWFLSVLFAYVTNRKYVFDSKNNQIIKEAISFFGSRLATGIMDMVLMWFLVNFNIVRPCSGSGANRTKFCRRYEWRCGLRMEQRRQF